MIVFLTARRSRDRLLTSPTLTPSLTGFPLRPCDEEMWSGREEKIPTKKVLSCGSKERWKVNTILAEDGQMASHFLVLYPAICLTGSCLHLHDPPLGFFTAATGFFLNSFVVAAVRVPEKNGGSLTLSSSLSSGSCLWNRL